VRAAALEPPSSAEARFSAALRRVAVPEIPPEPRGRKVDYGLLQEESKRVGDRGEEFVVNFEKRPWSGRAGPTWPRTCSGSPGKPGTAPGMTAFPSSGHP